MLKIMSSKNYDLLIDNHNNSIKAFKVAVEELKTDLKRSNRELERITSNYSNYKKQASLLKKFNKNWVCIWKEVYFVQDWNVKWWVIKSIELNDSWILYKLSNNYKVSWEELFTNKAKCIKYLKHILKTNK